MSFSFVSRQMTASTTSTAIYIAPADTTSIIFSGTICNTSDATSGTVNLSVVKANSNSAYILKNIELPYGSTLQIPKIVLETGDRILASTSAEVRALITV